MDLGATGRGGRARRALTTAAVLLAVVGSVAACSSGGATDTGVVRAVGAENQYADVLAQIGGRFVRVSSILDNPNTDPHTYETSPAVARELSTAQLVVQNGLGYDDFMQKLESASPSSSRKVVVVQKLLGLDDATPNPHLWYAPTTMPKVASALASDLSALQPAHQAYFAANLRRFDASLAAFTDAITSFAAKYAGVPVATTEPVADFLLEAMGADNLTPFRFQADVMNGVDPSPQDISLENGFFSAHRVKALCYNSQVVDALTSSIRARAEAAGVPVVAVYETMPPGYHYQGWMLAEVRAITDALTSGTSTEHL